MPDSGSVFLSYDHGDREAVLQIRAALQGSGIETFLDQKDLPGGLPWPKRLDDALRIASAVAVFIGRAGIGGWQEREMYFALDRQVEVEKAEGSFSVVPVLLPGAEPALVPGFLRLNTWVDLRGRLDDQEALSFLVRSLQGGPLPKKARLDVCPYRGLRPFGPADAGFFFGRERFVDSLVAKTLAGPVVAVVGPSGSGKSSVVLAGLVPRLRRRRPPEPTWDAVICRPGAHPWRGLADAFVPMFDRPESAGELAEDLAAGGGAVESAVRRALEASGGTDRLLLVVDQLEELFTLAPDETREPFLERLIEATRSETLHLALTLRADFYGHALKASRTLSDLMSESQVNLGPLTKSELREVIKGPAARVGLAFEEGLVETILADVLEQPGNLPLLEYALTQLWLDCHAAGRATLDAYAKGGGFTGAIAQRAETVYGLLSDEGKLLAQRLMTRLVRVASGGEEGSDTRRRVGRAELGEDLWPVAERFAKPDNRLLVLGRDPESGDQSAEVAHEAIIRHWDRLRRWIDKDREFHLWRQRLAVAMKPWVDTLHKDREALLRGQQLREGRGWLIRRRDLLNAEEKLFLRRSVSGSLRRRIVTRAALLLLLGLVALAAGLAAYSQTDSWQVRRVLLEGAKVGRANPEAVAQYETAVGLLGQTLTPRFVGEDPPMPIGWTDWEQWQEWAVWRMEAWRLLAGLERPRVADSPGLLRGFVLGGRVEEAARLIDQAGERDSKVLSPAPICGDACSKSILAQESARIGDHARAKRLLSETEALAADCHVLPDMIGAEALICLARSAHSLGDQNALARTLDKLEGLVESMPTPGGPGADPAGPFDSRTVWAQVDASIARDILASIAGLGRPEFAERYLQGDPDQLEDVMKGAVRFAIDEGRLDPALGLVERISDPQDGIRLELAKALVSDGRLDRAFGLLDDLDYQWNLVDPLDDLLRQERLDEAIELAAFDRRLSRGALMARLLEAGRLDEALTLSAVEPPQFATFGDVGGADRAIAAIARKRGLEAGKRALGILGDFHRREAAPPLLAAMLREGRRGEAEDLAREVATHSGRYGWLQESANDLLADALLGAGQTEEALALAADRRLNVTRGLEAAMIWGELELAERVAARIREPRERRWAMLRVAGLLLEERRVDEAARVASVVPVPWARDRGGTLVEVAESIDAHDYLRLRPEKLEAMARALDDSGYRRAADRLLAEAWRRISLPVEGERNREETSSLAAIYARLGRIRAAARVADLCVDPDYRLYAYGVILTEYERSRNQELSKNLLSLERRFPKPPESTPFQ